MVSVQLQSLLFVSDVFEIPSNNMRAYVFVYRVYHLWYTLIFVSDESLLASLLKNERMADCANIEAPSAALNIQHFPFH